MKYVTLFSHNRSRSMDTIFRTYTFLVSLFVCLMGSSQTSTFSVSGQILDRETSEPIAFASVYVQSESIGTTSNEEGLFVFHIPTGKEESSIIISIIGYAPISKRANTFGKNQKIFLSAKTTDLDEVVLTAAKKKKLTAKAIVRKAYKNIERNYPDQPYILEGYVRDLQKEDEKFVEYLECASKLFYQAHTVKKEPLVELVEVKTNYLGKKHPWNKKSERKNSIIDLVEDDLIRFDYGSIKGKNGWKYELEGILPYGNGLVYKINCIDEPFQTSTLFVDTKTFAFVRIELTRKSIDNKSWARRLTNGALQIYYNLVLEYQVYKGKMYLKYQKEEDSWRIFEDLESNEILFTKYPKKELFINKIIDDPENYPFEKNMDVGTSIENQANEYNADFWDTYNIPTQTEKESKIIKELRNRSN
ncbi:MAG: carboxypeptidase-like regulatory domain-containing protein [Bacteroidota bacterium]